MSLDFINEQQGWMLKGDGKFLSTIDGGHTWQIKSTLPTEAVGKSFSFDFVNSTTGFVVGEKGLILSTMDGGRSWERQINPTDGSIYDVAAADEQKVWAIGEKGLILMTDDGGIHWQEVNLSDNESPHRLAVQDGAAWFVVGRYVYRIP